MFSSDRISSRRGLISPASKVLFIAGLPLWISTLLLVGCKTASVSHYISPRVAGRVVDQATHLPIRHVKVQRLNKDGRYRGPERPKGGQALEQSPAVLTDENGYFHLDSLRDLSPFRSIGWWSVDISFAHPGYEYLIVTYTVESATNSPIGAPLVDAGDVQLVPKPNLPNR